jgi:hypothetical protein
MNGTYRRERRERRVKKYSDSLSVLGALCGEQEEIEWQLVLY